MGVGVGVAVGVGVGVAEGVAVGDAVGVGPGWQTLLPPGPEHWLEQQSEFFWQEMPPGMQKAVGVAVGVAVGSDSITNALLNVVVEVMSWPARSPTPSVPLGPNAPTATSNVPMRS